MDTRKDITKRLELLARFLDEREMRLLVVAEAESMGRGGIALVARSTGVSRRRISQGLKELGREGLEKRRIRRRGAGRKKAVEKDPSLERDLELLLDPCTRGDPESPLRWTSKSLRNLARELTAMGHPIGKSAVGRILARMGFSLQANRKTLEGSSHEDRDSQFRHISSTAQEFFKDQQPVVSVDAKKKELIGRFKNAGRKYHPKGTPEHVNVYDFMDKRLGKGIPYGVHDTARNEAWVSVGIDHDTASFAVESIRRWWYSMGRHSYPDAKKLMITADSGGSNGSRVRLWKLELQNLADDLAMELCVCHLPPGTSKWNKIEHRLFSFIAQNWRGKPLVSHEVIVNLIANTTTKTGLKVR
ncbi:MAG: ISAzo13 family transposase, partial [Deltaproteobacteria bacterium]|nr:ISAzo13 family transposase [Deltaproteobacteria bacterium]